MKNLQNDGCPAHKQSDQKKIRPFNSKTLLSFFGITMLLSSCEVIGGIFKAGMGVGIFLVIAVLLVIVFFVRRAGKK